MTQGDSSSALHSGHGGQQPHVLRDYALLADGLRGVLTDPDGKIAWMCFPTWEEPAVFVGLLGSGGSYRLGPTGRHVPGGYYEDGTLIWRQRWVTHEGVIESREALAYPGHPDRAMILRRITALESDASVSAVLDLTPDYGRGASAAWHREGPDWLASSDGLHARWSGAHDAATVQAQGGPGLALDLRLRRGQPHDLVLEIGCSGFSDRAPVDADDLWRRTASSWAAAIPDCHDVAAARDVRRSFAVLRGLTDPSGATVAAVTTALPERADAGRNYDYRYAWIRDTCYIGHAGAAIAGGDAMLDDAVRWVCARVLADGINTMPAYRGNGGPVPDPYKLGLPGYPGGSDVVGNQVRTQFQLDIFGEILLLLANAASKDRLDADGWRAAELALRAIDERGDEKESGIWEIGPDHWTHSRLICSAGLRAIAEHAPLPRWRTESLSLADRLLSEVDRTSLHPSGRWQRSPGDERIDASLLLAEIRGGLAPDDARSVATRRAVLEELCEDDYIYRYGHRGHPLGEDEGAFLICSFWMALASLRCGERERGVQFFERTRASCGTTGLFSEEYDVSQRQLRGNLPQSFVHALLIETAAEVGRG